MRLSVGIFAHNEERNIGATLESLFKQSLLISPQRLRIQSIEVLCLANGCTDRTVQVAQEFLANQARPASYRVVELPEPGKSRTWNRFVHELSDPEADYLILMDSDIVFERDDVLEQLIQRLLSERHAEVATDTPVKSFAAEPGKLSMADRASVAASKQVPKEGVLCGQLYCGRADALRRIWLPPALPVDDGFLSAMIKTQGFTADDDPTRIAWVPTARHFFRTHRSVSGFVSHEARIIVGSVINFWIFGKLWEEGRKGHVGEFVRQQNESNADWLSQLVREKVAAGGEWLIPAHFMLWRLAPLRGQPVSTQLKRAPIALAATALNLIACIRANQILKRENAASHW